MAVTALVYTAPLMDGYALVVPSAARRALAAAAQLQMEKPHASAIAVLVPASLGEHAGPRLRGAARDALRRVASELAIPVATLQTGPSRRWRLGLMATGWMLLIAAGQSWAQVLAGIWLAVVYPLFARWRSTRFQLGWDRRAVALGQLIEHAEVVLHEHAGLTALARALEAMEAPDTDRYAALAAACNGAGLSGLLDTYLTFAQGDASPHVDLIRFACEPNDSRQDATATPEEGEPPWSSSAVLSAQTS